MNYHKHFEDHKRINSKLQKIYDGDDFDIYQYIKSKFEYVLCKEDWIVYNLPKLMIDTITDMLFYEDPDVELNGEQLGVDYINHMQHSAKQMGINGGSVVQIILRDEKPYILHVDINNWCPILNELNPQLPEKGHIIRYIKEVERKKYYLYEVHLIEDKRIEYYAYDGEGKQASMNIFEDWGVLDLAVDGEGYVKQLDYEHSLVQYIPNTFSTKYYGESDITDTIITLSRKVNELKNQIQYVLWRHTNPKMVIPDRLINQAISDVQTRDEKAVEFNFNDAEEAKDLYQSNRSVFDQRVISKMMQQLEFVPESALETGQGPRYITWRAELAEAREQIKSLITDALTLGKTPEILFKRDESFGNLSGIALLRILQPTLNRVKTKSNVIKEKYAKIISVCEEIKGNEGEINIKFYDGVANDPAEFIDIARSKYESGLNSRQRAIMEANEVSEKEADEIAEQIDQETQLSINVGIDDPEADQ